MNRIIPEEALTHITRNSKQYRLVNAFLRYHGKRTKHVSADVMRLTRHAINSKKPYFFSLTSNGIHYVGDYHDFYSIHSLLRPDLDSGTIKFLKANISKVNGLCLDVGCNMGIISSALGSLVRPYPVIGIEPSPTTSLRAAAGISLNNLDNVNIIQAAIADRDEKIDFFEVPGFSEASSLLLTDKNHTRRVAVEVPCYRLDTLAEQLQWGSVGFIKLDVEGCELRAIQGAEKVIRKHRPKILFEFHPIIASNAGWLHSEVTDFLTTLGPYKFKCVAQDGSETEYSATSMIQDIVNIYCYV